MLGHWLRFAAALLVMGYMADIPAIAGVVADEVGCCAEEGSHDEPCPSSPACDCCLHPAPLPTVAVIALSSCGRPAAETSKTAPEGSSPDVFHVPRSTR
jgi:hypothetical protein